MCTLHFLKIVFLFFSVALLPTFLFMLRDIAADQENNSN